MRVSEDAQKVCAITIVGTVLKLGKIKLFKKKRGKRFR